MFFPLSANQEEDCPGECPEEWDCPVAVELSQTIHDKHRSPWVFSRTDVPVNEINFRLNRIHFLRDIRYKSKQNSQAKDYIERGIESIRFGHESIQLGGCLGENEPVATHKK